MLCIINRYFHLDTCNNEILLCTALSCFMQQQYFVAHPVVPLWMIQSHFAGFISQPLLYCWVFEVGHVLYFSQPSGRNGEVCTGGKDHFPATKYTAGQWNFLLPVSHYQHNQHGYGHLLVVVSEKCSFFFGDHGWGYIHWRPNLVSSSLATNSIFWCWNIS